MEYDKLRAELEKIAWYNYDPESSINIEEMLDDMMPLIKDKQEVMKKNAHDWMTVMWDMDVISHDHWDDGLEECEASLDSYLRGEHKIKGNKIHYGTLRDAHEECGHDCPERHKTHESPEKSELPYVRDEQSVIPDSPIIAPEQKQDMYQTPNIHVPLVHEQSWRERLDKLMTVKSFEGVRHPVYPGYSRLVAFIETELERATKEGKEEALHFMDATIRADEIRAEERKRLGVFDKPHQRPEDFVEDGIQAERDRIQQRVDFLRQWINERPVNARLVTNEQINYWLFDNPVDTLKDV